MHQYCAHMILDVLWRRRCSAAWPRARSRRMFSDLRYSRSWNAHGTECRALQCGTRRSPLPFVSATPGVGSVDCCPVAVGGALFSEPEVSVFVLCASFDLSCKMPLFVSGKLILSLTVFVATPPVACAISQFLTWTWTTHGAVRKRFPTARVGSVHLRCVDTGEGVRSLHPPIPFRQVKFSPHVQR